MNEQRLKIGQTVPHRPGRGILGSELVTARWHALRVTPGQERAKREILKREGVFAFFPEEERVRYVRGQKLVTKHPQVTQLIYAKFKHQPNWDVLRDRRIIAGVICSNSRPVSIPYSVIRAIQGLPQRAEVLMLAEAELATMRAGEQTELIEGPLAGIVVEVTSIKDGRVWWATREGIRGQASVSAMRGVITPIQPDHLDWLARNRGLDFAEACVEISERHCGQEAARPAARRLEVLRKELA